MNTLVTSLEQRLGGVYRVERELGGGAMSRVFLAEEIELGRRVVLKVLPPDLSEGLSEERFRREVQVAAKLQHPHIVPLLTAGRAGPTLYYVMPFVEGETLRERLAREGVLPVVDVIQLLRDVAEALAYAHRSGIVHRDVKPENILITNSHALIADFGIAKAISDGLDAPHITAAGVALGTPTYMSPEQAAGDRNIDTRADLYAVGVVGYEMLTGRPPFARSSPYEMLAAHIADDPDPVARHRADTSGPLARVVMQCLEKRREDRFASADQLVAALHHAAMELSAESRAPRSPPRRARLGWVAVALAAGLGVGVGARAAGLGATRSLVAQGALREREPVLLADLANRTPDSSLGIAMTEALRTDLAQSSAVMVLPASRVRQALRRMQRDSVRTVDLELAREAAQREGIKAVIAGDVASVGNGYVVALRIVNAATGEVLAGFRESAEGSGDVISAVDRVSKQLRRRIGESVQALAKAPSLEQVTTSSLEALRAYSEARRALADGRFDRAALLLEESIRLDSTFASAYRALAATYDNWGQNPAGAIQGVLKAYEYRYRLPERERLLAEAQYYSEIDRRPERAAAAYEAVLALNADDVTALTNLGNLHRDLGAIDKALALHRRALAIGAATMYHMNVAFDQAARGDTAALDSVMQRWTAAQPASAPLPVYRGFQAFTLGRYDEAAYRFQEAIRRNAESATWTALSHEGLASVARLQGRLRSAGRHDREARRARGGGETAEQPTSPGVEALAEVLVSSAQDLLIRDRPAEAARILDGALRRISLADIPVTERPYLELAYRYTVAGRIGAARELLAARDRALRELGAAGAAILQRDGHEVQPLIVQGRLAAAEHRLDDAVAALRLAEARREHLTALPELAIVLDQAGEHDSAIAVYERYLARGWLERHRTDGWHRARALYRLAELYEARGDRERAAQHYGEFAALWRGADSELQPRVREARSRIAALNQEPATR